MVINAKTSAKAIGRQLTHSFGYQASQSSIYKAKAAIMNDMWGDEVESFARLPAYVEALHAADKGTVAALDVNSAGIFQRIFVCPGACRQAWLHCRRWIAIDATFMKTKYNVRLHLAAAMDGTGSLLVLAWALSPGKTEESWT
ncbi:hypothetical protein A4X13_0g9658 [Tilletia indica]|uniref:MULE transposase domain-containing protein n=1 Tax=Tilletia indica TaxID=43049 RepID=A0A8T8S8B5_9BASI|nr:hypothetical protein A4X13_0g9658 [Tilletia indica]